MFYVSPGLHPNHFDKTSFQTWLNAMKISLILLYILKDGHPEVNINDLLKSMFVLRTIHGIRTLPSQLLKLFLVLYGNSSYTIKST